QIDSSSEKKELYEEVEETLSTTQGNQPSIINRGSTSLPVTQSTTTQPLSIPYSTETRSTMKPVIPTRLQTDTTASTETTPQSLHYQTTFGSNTNHPSHSNHGIESEKRIDPTIMHPVTTTRRIQSTRRRGEKERSTDERVKDIEESGETTVIPSERDMSEEWILIGRSTTTEASITTESFPSTTESTITPSIPPSTSPSTITSSHPTRTHFIIPSMATEKPRFFKIHFPFKRHSPLPIDHLIHLMTTPSPSPSPTPSSPSTTERVIVHETTTQLPPSTTTTAQPVTDSITKAVKKMKKKTPKPASLGNFNGNPLMFGVPKKSSPSTTTEGTTTTRTTKAPTTTEPEIVTETPIPSTTSSIPPPSTSPSTLPPHSSSSLITHIPSTRIPFSQIWTEGITRERSTATTEKPVIEVEVNTISPRPSTSLPTTERTHHHSPRAITFARPTDRPSTQTPPSTSKWTSTTPFIDSFPTTPSVPLVVVPDATPFFLLSTQRTTHFPTTVHRSSPTTVSPTNPSTVLRTDPTIVFHASPTTVPWSIPSTSSEPITDPTITLTPVSTSEPTTTIPPPTLIPPNPEDFDFEASATTTEQASTKEIEAELPSREGEEETPFLPPHATVPKGRVSVDAANVVNEEPDKEGPLGVSIKRNKTKKTIKPYAASTTARTMTMKPEKRCCPCCAENLENSPSSTARPVRHSIAPTVVSTTFAPIAHTNPPQYVVNFYEQQQIPLSRPLPPSYIPQPPPPPVYLPPPRPSPPCPCAAQEAKPCCDLKPCCRDEYVPPPCPLPSPRPCCQPLQQLCCQPNLLEQIMAPARQLFGALGSLYAPPANNCGVCQGSAYRIARVKRTATGCSQCSGRRKRETTNEEHLRMKRTAGCASRAVRAKRTTNGKCADCSSINGIFHRQKRTAVNNRERGYEDETRETRETLLTCDSSCCDFTRCDQVRIFTSRKRVV
ncbi:hypothetical protein PENTCL1PPCAC_22971, partial [Pristionchus entomophagus]